MLKTRRWIGLAAFAFAGVAAACSSSSPSENGGSTSDTPVAEATIGSSGGQVATVDGDLTVTVPAGALASDVTITVSEIASPVAGVIGKAYEIGPTGTQFSVPVTLAFRYGGVDLENNDPSTLEVATVVDGDWAALSGDALDTVHQIASGQTTHLSPYAIHIRGKHADGGADLDAIASHEGSASSDGTVSDVSTDVNPDAVADSSSDGPHDSGFDATGCTQGAFQVGSCANHPIQICSASYVFTNCVDQTQGFTYLCCPTGG